MASRNRPYLWVQRLSRRKPALPWLKFYARRACSPAIWRSCGAQRLGFSYVRIGEIGPDSSNSEVWAYESQTLSGIQGSSSHALTLDDLERLIEAATPAGSDAVMGFTLDEAILSRIVPGQPATPPETTPRPLILMMLESTSGGTLGYMLAALDPETQRENATERD